MEGSCAWVGAAPATATPSRGISLRTCLLCTNVRRACVLAQVVLIMITPTATEGGRQENTAGGRKETAAAAAAAGCSFPIAIYDLWTLFWFAAETPTIAHGRIGAGAWVSSTETDRSCPTRSYDLYPPSLTPSLFHPFPFVITGGREGGRML